MCFKTKGEVPRVVCFEAFRQPLLLPSLKLNKSAFFSRFPISCFLRSDAEKICSDFISFHPQSFQIMRKICKKATYFFIPSIS